MAGLGGDHPADGLEDGVQLVLRDPEASAAFLTNIPLGRFGEPEEIGGIALLLASEAGAFITGAAFMIDGGWTAR